MPSSENVVSSRIDASSFLEWLFQQMPDAIVGIPKSINRCPVARWLDSLGYQGVHVIYRHTGDPSNTLYACWRDPADGEVKRIWLDRTLAIFVGIIDDVLGYNSITADMATKALIRAMRIRSGWIR